jgi:Tfp pilus assembly protein PilF
MTLKTCLNQLKIAEKKGDKDRVEFWKARITKKYPKFKEEKKAKK